MEAPPSQTPAAGLSREPAGTHRRWYEIAGVTIQVESPLPILTTTFAPKFALFEVDGPGPDTVVLRHHFGLPEDDLKSGGDEVYRGPPWAIFRTREGWVYEGIAPRAGDPTLHRVAVFNSDHTRGDLYNPLEAVDWWEHGGLASLSMFPSDQVWLARLLPDRHACFLHSGGVILDGQGLLFVGHSDAGKSTTVEMMKRALAERVEILCDDRNIVRRWPAATEGDAAAVGRQGLWVHGAWSHGDVPEVSPRGAPLRAVLFLMQSSANELVPIGDRKVVWHRLLSTVIRPLVGGEWWQRVMDVLDGIVSEVPCHMMRFDRSGAIVPEVERLVR